MHDWGILPPPLDDFHVAERVNLWWTLYLLDRLIAIMAGIPSLCLLDAFRVSLPSHSAGNLSDGCCRNR